VLGDHQGAVSCAIGLVWPRRCGSGPDGGRKRASCWRTLGSAARRRGLELGGCG
jgi:hypothetical protein